ncbi:MAG: hypothetical protein JWM52_499 [Candidatus Saccharibacteria bacterium]|nr:hypothetical protein [Candidatus Saccharibacteria bacterium]
MKPEDEQNYWENPDEAPVEDKQVTSEDETYPEEEEAPKSETVLPEAAPVTWTAKEYIHPDKSPLWFVVFIIVVLGLISIDIFFLHSWTFTGLVVVMAVALVIYTRRPPRDLTYGLSGNQGLYVGEKLYHYDEFKAFGLIKDGEHNSIMLIPRKRFSPGVSVYFPAESGEQIVDMLGQRLPMEDLKLDIIDVVIRKLRL